ncbi:MAG: hypothetical protein WD848_03940 [Dehalococcoidia bacterium]
MTTDFLFARPSFWRGVGRLFDLGGTWFEFNRSLTEQQADSVAMYQDWNAVGLDIQVSIDTVREDIDSKQGRLPL